MLGSTWARQVKVRLSWSCSLKFPVGLSIRVPPAGLSNSSRRATVTRTWHRCQCGGLPVNPMMPSESPLTVRAAAGDLAPAGPHPRTWSMLKKKSFECPSHPGPAVLCQGSPTHAYTTIFWIERAQRKGYEQSNRTKLEWERATE